MFWCDCSDPVALPLLFKCFLFSPPPCRVEHIVGNLLMQLLLGIPLELVHKGFEVGMVYLAGVLAGGAAPQFSTWWLFQWWCLSGFSDSAPVFHFSPRFFVQFHLWSSQCFGGRFWGRLCPNRGILHECSGGKLVNMHQLLFFPDLHSVHLRIGSVLDVIWLFLVCLSVFPVLLQQQSFFQSTEFPRDDSSPRSVSYSCHCDTG